MRKREQGKELRKIPILNTSYPISRGLLKTPSDHTAEHIHTHALALDLAARLVLLVRGHLDNSAVGTRLVHLPAADLGDELLEGLAAAQVEPLLQHLGVDLPEGLADLDGDTDAHELLEAGDVGDQVRVQVIGVQGGPELGVLGGLEEGGQAGELLDGFDEVGGLGGVGVGGGEGLGVGGEEGKAEGEGGRGEDGESLGKDVGDGFGLEEVRVELVAVDILSVSEVYGLSQGNKAS